MRLRPRPRPQAARWGVLGMLLVLVLVQLLGQVHRIRHVHTGEPASSSALPPAFAQPLWPAALAGLGPGHRHGPGHAHDASHRHSHGAAPCEDAAPEAFWDRLFAGHDHLSDCDAYDHLSQTTGLPSAGLFEGSVSRPGLQVDEWVAAHRAAETQAYLARGPPRGS